MITRSAFNFPGMGWVNPFSEIERLRREVNQLTRAMFGGTETPWLSAGVFPLVNITEDNSRYYVRAELPGMKPDELAVQVHGQKITLSGERKIAFEGEKAKYHRREREAGKFSRVIELPGAIKADKIDAKMVNGLLTIAIDKAETAKPRQIAINAKG